LEVVVGALEAALADVQGGLEELNGQVPRDGGVGPNGPLGPTPARETAAALAVRRLGSAIQRMNAAAAPLGHRMLDAALARLYDLMASPATSLTVFSTPGAGGASADRSRQPLRGAYAKAGAGSRPRGGAGSGAAALLAATALWSSTNLPTVPPTLLPLAVRLWPGGRDASGERPGLTGGLSGEEQALVGPFGGLSRHRVLSEVGCPALLGVGCLGGLLVVEKLVAAHVPDRHTTLPASALPGILETCGLLLDGPGWATEDGDNPSESLEAEGAFLEVMTKPYPSNPLVFES
jgi:hypothetical protein